MNNPFDIMKVLSDDTLAWVEATDDMNAAKTRVCELLADSPGEYIVFNQDTKELVSHFSAHEPSRAVEYSEPELEVEETFLQVAFSDALASAPVA